MAFEETSKVQIVRTKAFIPMAFGSEGVDFYDFLALNAESLANQYLTTLIKLYSKVNLFFSLVNSNDLLNAKQNSAEYQPQTPIEPSGLSKKYLAYTSGEISQPWR